MNLAINIYNQDCLPAMKKMEDNQYDLAIIDTPYGIDAANIKKRGGNKIRDAYESKGWDKNIPDIKYFKELFRVSKNQIIWGGNYYNLPLTGAWIFWDKQQPLSFDFTFSAGELAWTSFSYPLKKVIIKRNEHRNVVSNNKTKAKINQWIHPTQKPVALYKWLLKNYAKEGNRILDTHMGSGSIAIACWDYGFDLEAYEIDKDYYEAAIKRLNEHKRQLKFEFI